MAITSGTSVAQVVSQALFATVKNELKQRFVEMVTKEIEPILDEYTRQIVIQVAEMRDPHSLNGIKINVTFKLPEPKEKT